MSTRPRIIVHREPETVRNLADGRTRIVVHREHWDSRPPVGSAEPRGLLPPPPASTPEPPPRKPDEGHPLKVSNPDEVRSVRGKIRTRPPASEAKRAACARAAERRAEIARMRNRDRDTRIVGLASNGNSVRAIAEQLGVAKSTVGDVLKRDRETRAAARVTARLLALDK